MSDEPLLLHSDQQQRDIVHVSYNTCASPSASAASASLSICLVVSGSRGELQPFLALSLALQSRGHSVRIATERRLESLVRSRPGLQYFPLAGDPTGLLYEPQAQPVLQQGSMMGLVRLTEEWDKKFDKREIFNSALRACEGVDLIIATALTMSYVHSVAEKLKVPWVPIILGPTLPTSEFPIWPLEKFILCSCLNKWSYNVAFRMLWKSDAKTINPWRVEELGLPALTESRGIADILDRVCPPTIIAASKLLCGKRGEVPSDYPAYAHMLGFFFLPVEVDDAVPQEAIDFLSPETSDLPVVYLGFGSMPASQPLDLVQLAVDVIEKCGCRAVLVAGWSVIDTPECLRIVEPVVKSRRLLMLKSIPHVWLFPKMSCIVHHCGVGTMASALLAGKPQIPCPVMLDQPHNADIVVKLKCALDTIPYTQIFNKTEKFFSVLRRTLKNDCDILQNTERMRHQILLESEHAISTAVSLLENYASDWCVHKKDK